MFLQVVMNIVFGKWSVFKGDVDVEVESSFLLHESPLAHHFQKLEFKRKKIIRRFGFF